MNDDEIRTPKRIYLQIDKYYHLPTTWSDDSIYDTDIEYIRSDIHESRIKELEQTAITMDEVYQDTLDKLKKQYKTEEHKCCGHCKRESDNERRDVE